jgi:hypothetical protein
MKRFAKFIAVFALVICLPLESLAAVTMPACDAPCGTTHTKAMQVDNANGMTGMSHCKQAMSHHCNMEHKSGKSSCNQCNACSLSVAQAVLDYALPSVTAISSDAVPSGLEITKPTAVSTSLFRPPITISA